MSQLVSLGSPPEIRSEAVNNAADALRPVESKTNQVAQNVFSPPSKRVNFKIPPTNTARFSELRSQQGQGQLPLSAMCAVAEHVGKIQNRLQVPMKLIIPMQEEVITPSALKYIDDATQNAQKGGSGIKEEAADPDNLKLTKLPNAVRRGKHPTVPLLENSMGHFFILYAPFSNPDLNQGPKTFSKQGTERVAQYEYDLTVEQLITGNYGLFQKTKGTGRTVEKDPEIVPSKKDRFKVNNKVVAKWAKKVAKNVFKKVLKQNVTNNL